MPVGTGFSYNKLKPVTDTKTLARHFINFLAKFFKNFPFGLGNNPVYIAG
jgi:carboxypeptidase C (cathepsin A)